MPYLGESFALSTAVIWAFAVILFKKSGEVVDPIALNLFKNTLAMLLLIPTIVISGESIKGLFDAGDYALLILSGILGIGIADTLFFKSLNLLGAGLSAIVDCLYSPFIISLSIIWLGEDLSVIQALGATLIISAVLTISRINQKEKMNRPNLIWGIIWGATAMATMAIGIVMIKPLLNRSPLFWLTEMRILGGEAFLAIVLLFHGRRRQMLSPHLTPASRFYTIFGSFLGAYLAMILWLAGMKFTQMSIAAALNQTSNIFIFIFAALILKEPITARRVAGIFLGVTGALMVTFG